MNVKPPTRAITVSTTLGAADPLEIRSGPAIPPIERLKLFSPSDWENCINEWASEHPGYQLVERAGGAGDMGCDVVATLDPNDPSSPWDNYQCKHYDHSLVPSDIWLELAKLCYFSHLGAFTVPRHYYFVAPRGIGTKLMRLLKKPDELRDGLIAAWPAKCADHLVASKSVALNGALESYVKSFDFGKVRHMPPIKLIEGLMKTRYFAVRFGLGLPPRSPSPLPPTDIQPAESRYVAQLLAAYGDNLKRPVTLKGLSALHSTHFKRARESFYCAEALRNFSRDTLPDGVFENLQNQIYDGVIDVVETDHPCGLTRVNATTNQAVALALSSSALLGRVEISDRRGICHQLANSDRLVWVQTHV